MLERVWPALESHDNERGELLSYLVTGGGGGGNRVTGGLAFLPASLLGVLAGGGGGEGEVLTVLEVGGGVGVVGAGRPDWSQSGPECWY